MEFLFLKYPKIFMDTISHSKRNLLGKFYMHQKNNAPLLTKNANFVFFPWTLLGQFKKGTDLNVYIHIQ